ncbi:hypothetical protein JCM10213v2_006027 [Rhodosporidiobolus nylandii]
MKHHYDVLHALFNSPPWLAIIKHLNNFTAAHFPAVYERYRNTNHPDSIFGDFESNEQGYIVLHELCMVVEVPPGVAIAFPSALITHSNIDVVAAKTREEARRGKGRTRGSIPTLPTIPPASLNYIHQFSDQRNSAADFLPTQPSKQQAESQLLRKDADEPLTAVIQALEDDADGDSDADSGPRLGEQTTAKALREKRRAAQVGRPKTDALKASNVEQRLAEAEEAGMPVSVRALLFETAPDVLASHAVAVTASPNAGKWIVAQSRHGYVKELLSFRAVKSCDNDYFEVGNYFKGGSPSRVDGGPGLVDPNEGLRWLEMGKEIGPSRTGQAFAGQLMIPPAPTDAEYPAAEEGGGREKYPMLEIPPPQGYAGTGDGTNGVGRRKQQHDVRFSRRLPNHIQPEGPPPRQVQQTKGLSSTPAVTDVAGRGHPVFPSTPTSTALSTDYVVNLWRLTSVGIFYLRTFTVILENALFHLLNLARGRPSLEFAAFLAQTPLSNVRYLPLPQDALLPTNIALPLYTYGKAGIAKACLLFSNFVKKQQRAVFHLPEPARVAVPTVSLSRQFFTDHLHELTDFQLEEPGRLGKLRLRIIVPGKEVVLTSLDGCVNFWPAISTKDSRDSVLDEMGKREHFINDLVRKSN